MLSTRNRGPEKIQMRFELEKIKKMDFKIYLIYQKKGTNQNQNGQLRKKLWTIDQGVDNSNNQQIC